jgi:5,10-methylene-tetrahydrofolate dehydrogenase/methenyl tetrahydrofolate cyclohydrolase
MEAKNCDEVGFEHLGIVLPQSTTEKTLLRHIQQLNEDEKISGIIVQMPLPRNMSMQRVFEEISPEKDLDGVHPSNLVNLVIREKEPLHMPCTTKSCLYIIQKYCPSVIGKRVVVLGQSMIVGVPVAFSLQNLDATVTSCNIMTRNIEAITREADILVISIGNPLYVRGDWIKPGALVIDVGTSVIPDSSSKTGQRVVGDVNFNEAVRVAGHITPVPGGVGPMTNAMLLQNVFTAWRRANFPTKLPYV